MNIRRDKNFYFLLCMGVVFIAGCAKYKPSTLPYPSGQKKVAEDITVAVRVLTNSECRTCFDSDDLAKQYRAVQISVFNDGDEPVVLSANDIGLPVENAAKVAKVIHRKTLRRVGLYAAGAFFIWPFIIPAAVDGAKSSAANKEIDMDVANKVLGQNEQVRIMPRNSVNKVVFIKNHRSLPASFSVRLFTELTRRAIEFSSYV